MWCGAVLGHFQHHTLWCGLAKTITVPYLIFAITYAVRYGVVQNLAKTITAPRLIFAVTCAILCIRCNLKQVYFSNFGLFLLSPKLIFPLFFWLSFKLLSQFFFILGWLFQSTLARVIKLFFWKTKVIKLLIIYLILKINKYINI